MSGQHRKRGQYSNPLSGQRIWTDEDWAAIKWAGWDFIRGAPMFQGRGPQPARLGHAVVRWTGAAVAAVLAARGRLSPDTLDPAVLTRTAWGVWAAAAIVLAVLGHQAIERWRLRDFRTEVIDPLHDELCHELWACDPRDKRATEYIHATPDLADDPGGVRIALPRGINGNEDKQKKIRSIVLSTLRYSEEGVSASYIFGGRHRYMRVIAKRRVPGKGEVDFADGAIHEIVAVAADSRPVIALGAPKANGDPTPITIPFDDEAPHFAVSARTRIGKSAMMRLLAAQVMHHGGRVVILDYKRRSHRWAKGLEGVIYCRSIAEIHRKLVELAEEATVRNTLADDYPPDQEPPWQRVLVIVEEMNSLMEELIFHWRHEVEGKGVSPAIRGLRHLGNMAGGVKMHLAAIAQLLTAQAAGGAGSGGSVARANYGMIAAAGFDTRGWKMLAGDAPMPKGKRPKGRAHFIADGGASIVEGQTIWMTEREAREWAAGGMSSRPRQTQHTQVPADLSSLGETSAVTAGPPTLTLVSDELVTLAEASRDRGRGLVRMNYQGLRSRRDTDSEFPEPVDTAGKAHKWRVSDLLRYDRNREDAPR